MNTLHGIDTSTLSFSTRSDLFDNGNHCEDGSELVGSHHYVVATTQDGRQFFRHVGTSSWMYDCDEDEGGDPMYYRTNEPEYLNGISDKLAERLTDIESPSLRDCQWFEGEAAYGTNAYLRQEAYA